MILMYRKSALPPRAPLRAVSALTHTNLMSCRQQKESQLWILELFGLSPLYSTKISFNRLVIFKKNLGPRSKFLTPKG